MKNAEFHEAGGSSAGASPLHPVRDNAQLIHKTCFRALLEGTTKQGATRPLYPCGRAIRPAPFLRQNRMCRKWLFPHDTLENQAVSATGAMKTLKKVGWESKLSHRPFFMFSPDATASGRRWNTAQPVGGSAAANSQYDRLFPQKDFCVYACATPNYHVSIFL